MLSDEEELRNIKETQNIYHDMSFYKELEMVPFDDEKILQFHKYMKSLAQDLLGDEINLDKENLVFLLSNDKTPNAAFVHYPKGDDKQFIYVSSALFELCDNKDQFAFILGHELQHFIEKGVHGEHTNTKAEETYADLNAIPKMARAGLNIEEASHIAEKIFESSKITLNVLKDEHLSNDERKKLINMRITQERRDLRQKGLASEDVTGSKTHSFEENFINLLQTRPKSESLRDFFESKEYINAPYDKKVDIFFAKLQETITLVQHETHGEIYARFTSLDEKIFIEEVKKLRNLQQPNDYHFEQKYLDFMLNEENAVKAYSKFYAMRNIVKEHECHFPADVFGNYIKEKFNHLNELTDKKQLDLAFMNMDIVHRATSTQEEWLNLRCGLFDLNCNQDDIGKSFSKEMLFHTEINSTNKYSLDNHFKVRRMNYGDVCLYFESERYNGAFFLLDKEGKIKAVEKDETKIQERMIAEQINETVKILNDIHQGKKIDENLKLQTLLNAFKMTSPYIVFTNKETGERSISFDLNKNEMGLQPFDNNDTFDLKNIEQYLTPEAKVFWTEKYDQTKPQIHSDMITETLVKGIEKDFSIDQLNNDIILFLEQVKTNNIETRLPQFEKITTAFLNREGAEFPASVIRKITDIKLYQHLNSGQNLDTFVSPFDKEMQEYYNKVKEEGNLDWKIDTFCTYEMLKKNPKIDLSQVRTNQFFLSESLIEHISISSDYFENKENILEQLKKRIQSNINNPNNWGDGKIEKGCCEGSFNERFSLITERSYKLNDKEVLQDIALHFYQQAPVEDKIQYMATAVGNTINNTARKDVYLAVKEKIWNIIGKDLENKDVSLKNRIELFIAFDKNKLFDDEKKHYFETLVGQNGTGGLLKEMDEAPLPKSALYLRLLDSDNRIPDPDIRKQIINKAVQSWWQENGSVNDMTANKQEEQTLIQKIRTLKETELKKIPVTDEHQFLRELAEISCSQKELSETIRPNPDKINTQDKKLIAGTYGLDTLTYLMQEGAVNRETVMNYLLSDGSPQQTADAHKKVIEDLYYHASKLVDKYKNTFKPTHLEQAKKEFDAAPLEGKAAIINLLSESSNWEKQFDQVANKLFKDAGELGKLGKKFLHAYISSREGSERGFYPSAMYVAANNNTVTFDDKSNPYTKEQRALAQGLRLFLENSGPAGVKLAQAMSSYSDVPDFIRDEMQNAKNNANPPARWEVFDWLEDSGENKALEHGKLGKILGSASFFVTYDMKDDDGNNKVVKFLRQGSKNLAEAEFKVYQDMLVKMKDEFKGIESFKRLIDNAASMVDVETDLNIGEQQLRDAQALYPDKTKGDNVDFNIKVMDWEGRGKTWAVMERAEGEDFKNLEQPYKKAVAKAVFTTELANMLSGKRFDSDRHAGQYKIDTSTNTIGVFDTGSVSVVEPSEKEKMVLGAVLAHTVNTLMNDSKQDVASTLCAEIDKGVAHFYQKEISEGKPIPPYLSEFQRGLLALTDFHKEIPPQELGVCLMQALNNGKNHLDPAIYKGFTETMLAQRQNMTTTPPEITEAIATHVLTPQTEVPQTKEAQLAQMCGKKIAETIFENHSIYGALTHLPEQIKSEETLNILQSSAGQIHFAKGMMKELMHKIDPNTYESSDKKQVGALLYKVIEEGMKKKKLHQDVSLPKIFEEEAKKMPQLGDYAQTLQTISHIAEKIDATTDMETFKQAVLLGRFIDKDVQKGYNEALRKSPDSSFIKKTLSHISPLQFVPQKASRKVAKFIIKKIAPKCVKMFSEKQKETGQNKNNQTR